MKKLFLLLALAGLVIISSCKKEECPKCEEPEENQVELHGAGTWAASKVIYQGQDLTNSGDPTVDCWLMDQIVLNDTQDGTSWDFTDYDTDTSTCEAYNLNVTAWAENYEKGMLYVTITYNQTLYTFDFIFVSDTQIKKLWSGGELEIYYDKQ